MKVLIIGGTGNISTAITKHFIDQGGNEVYLFKRDSSIVEGAITITGDRNDYCSFEEKLANIGEFDAVIDMICFEPDDARSDARAFRNKTKQFILCSTVDVFTKPALRYPVFEEDEKNPSILFPYAYKKGICENILRDAAERGDFKLTILRPVATYNDKSFPIPLIANGDQLLRRIKDKKPVIVLGDASSFWVSCHREDAAAAFWGAVGNEKTFGKSYNLSGDETITWEAYYNTIAKVMGIGKIDFVHIPTDLLVRIAPKAAEWCGINFRYNNIFDNSEAKRDLGFKYTVTWEEGVRRMLNYHNSSGDFEKVHENVFYNLIVEKYKSMGDELVYQLSRFDT